MSPDLTAADGSSPRAEARVAGLTTALKAAAKMASRLDQHEVITDMVAGLRQLAPCRVVAVYFLSPEDLRPKVVAAYSIATERWPALERVLDQHIPPVLLESPSPLILEGASAEVVGSLLGSLRAHQGENEAVVAVPISTGGESLGAALLGGVSIAAFSHDQLLSLGYFAQHAAVAITNARLHQRMRASLRTRQRDLANLSQIGQAIGASLQPTAVLDNIVRGIAEAFTSAGSALILLDSELGDLYVAADAGMSLAGVGRRVSAEGSASGWVIRHVGPLFLPSVRDSAFPPVRSWFEREGIKSFIGVPLVVQGVAIGSLNVYSRIGQRFDSSDVDLLQGLAAQAAIAITHSKLYESLGREKANLEAVVESLHEGLLLVHPDGTAAYANRRFADCHGHGQELAPDTTVDRVWEALAERSASPAETLEKLKALDTDLPQTTEFVVSFPCEQHFEVDGFPVLSAQGDLLGRGYLVHDVTQRAEIDRLKASMLSIVSHELRSPLAAIKGFATSLLRSDVVWDEASKRDFLEQIDREADRLDGLVTSLLDMSRLEAGMIRLDREWCDLAELLADILGRMAPIIAHHQVNIEVGSTTVLGFVDRRYLERVVWNLVENAVHYSPPGSTVAVSIAMEGDDFLLRVRDHGIGIKAEERDKVFQRFYRGPKARPGGVGLGLAICQGIVEAHGGTISFDSEPRKGSVFTVRVPCHPTGVVD